ncbi:hypothetical protein B0H13DRAFT_2103943 [Mycena leptocephala]|nr:hypothetical protein B0H13DRAFT_2103943 [Mycena leptocephala]
MISPKPKRKQNTIRIRSHAAQKKEKKRKRKRKCESAPRQPIPTSPTSYRLLDSDRALLDAQCPRMSGRQHVMWMWTQNERKGRKYSPLQLPPNLSQQRSRVPSIHPSILRRTHYGDGTTYGEPTRPRAAGHIPPRGFDDETEGLARCAPHARRTCTPTSTALAAHRPRSLQSLGIKQSGENVIDVHVRVNGERHKLRRGSRRGCRHHCRWWDPREPRVREESACQAGQGADGTSDSHARGRRGSMRSPPRAGRQHTRTV